MGHFDSGVTIATALHQRDQARNDGHRSVLGLTGPAFGFGVRQQVEPLPRRNHQCRELVPVAAVRPTREPLARHFSNRGRDLLSQFDHVAHVPSPLSGTPLIDDALAWLECTTYGMHDGGDHTIVVGQIVRASGLPSDDDLKRPASLDVLSGAYSSGRERR